MGQSLALANSPSDTYHLCREGCRDDGLIGQVEASGSILQNLDAAKIYLTWVHVDNRSFSSAQ